jgi:hypothetical protein
VPVAVEGLSEREFAEQAAALLEVTGIRPLTELGGSGAPAPAAGRAFADDLREVYDPDWSNLGPLEERDAHNTSTGRRNRYTGCSTLLLVPKVTPL